MTLPHLCLALATSDLRAFELLRSAVWVFDPERGRILYANRASLDLWQAPDMAELLARDFSQVSDAIRLRIGAHLPRLGRGEDVRERCTFYPHGKPLAVDCRISGIQIESGPLAMLTEASEIDVTPHELRALEALRHTSVLVRLFDEDARPIFRNPAAEAAYSEADAVFSSAFIAQAEAVAAWDAILAAGGAIWRGTAEVTTTRGRRWHRLDGHTMLDPVTGKLCLILDEHDITGEVEAQARIEHIATHDALTDLPNRSLLQCQLEAALVNGCSVALLCLDLDRFKPVNDRLGHAAGDELLRAVARRLLHCTQNHTGVVARIGGDEFAILLTDLDTPEAAAELAANVIESVRRIFTLAAGRVSISVSVGIAFLAADGTSDRLMYEADLALYRAKSRGRNTFSVFDDPDHRGLLASHEMLKPFSK